MNETTNVKDPVEEAVNAAKPKKKKVILVRKRYCPECDKVVSAGYKDNKCTRCGTQTKRKYEHRNTKKYKRTWAQRKRMSIAQKKYWAEKKKNGATRKPNVGPKLLEVNGITYINSQYLVDTMSVTIVGIVKGEV